jgi:hypothetical protein
MSNYTQAQRDLAELEANNAREFDRLDAMIEIVERERADAREDLNDEWIGTLRPHLGKLGSPDEVGNLMADLIDSIREEEGRAVYECLAHDMRREIEDELQLQFETKLAAAKERMFQHVRCHIAHLIDQAEGLEDSKNELLADFAADVANDLRELLEGI